MGPPLRRMKPFLKLSQQQQKRRIRVLVQADLAYLANAANNAASSPTRPPSCSPPTARASNIPDDVCHQIDDFFERFDDTEDLNLLINERPTLTNTDIQLENQAQSTITRPTSITNLQDFLAHWAIQNKIPQSVVNDLLRGLKKFGHPELPSDARTLCDTPNKTDIQALAGGTYVHYGLERALKEQLRKYNMVVDRNEKILRIAFYKN
ncbi:uncharacterized protein LOC143907935 isoform X1 [Temnothorax americanus]|uniref:uncharacterized protein LOC143907935 isoform X1 n=1 Tax=Temnothorax americanus TaxID=1964332 RepID=UPI004068AC68